MQEEIVIEFLIFFSITTLRYYIGRNILPAQTSQLYEQASITNFEKVFNFYGESQSVVQHFCSVHIQILDGRKSNQKHLFLFPTVLRFLFRLQKVTWLDWNIWDFGRWSKPTNNSLTREAQYTIFLLVETSQRWTAAFRNRQEWKRERHLSYEQLIHYVHLIIPPRMQTVFEERERSSSWGRYFHFNWTGDRHYECSWQLDTKSCTHKCFLRIGRF